MNRIPSPIPTWLLPLALGSALMAQNPNGAANARLDTDAWLRAAPAPAAEHVLFDAPGDGRLWAVGSTYKASFGADGFVYVPFFGSDAPRNYPVRFVLRSVRVGGRDLEFRAEATATRHGATVTFDRGLVREVYDLTLTGVEQTFEVDGTLAGDVDVELDVVSDLTEDATRAGVQFGNHLGHVAYGTAWLVRGTEKVEIPTAMHANTIRLHVPATQRGAGAVVIDPLVTTVAATATLKDSAVPDVAYDATTDRWCLTWVHVFSQTDHDVVAELRNGNGDPIAGTFTTIDPTTMSHSWPRVANLNSADRFLITMERYVPGNPAGQQYTIWGRTMDAPAPFTKGAHFEISPASNADQLSADVGGDPGTGTRWTVVWRHGVDIFARQVEANGTLSPNTIPVDNTSAACINPQISLSNGNGLTGTPRWCIVYMVRVSDTNWDVFGSALDPNGVLTRRHIAISTGTSNDMYTYVSSPLTDTANGPAFLVSYERQETAAPEMVVRVVDANLNTPIPEVNLTRRYGFIGIYCRVESDGTRFAAVSRYGTQNVGAGTLALVNNDLVLHEAIVSIGNGDAPCVASKRSGGGGVTDYAVPFVHLAANPDRVYVGLYQGRAPSGGFNRRGMNCGLGVNYGGRPYLGDVVTFTLSNAGSDQTGFLLGTPVPATPLCGSCSFGLDLASPLIPFPAPLSLPLPRQVSLVGVSAGVQGFAIGSGTCLGSLRFSDTVDFTIQ